MTYFLIQTESMLIYRALSTYWMCVKHEQTSVHKKGEARRSGVNTNPVQKTKSVYYGDSISYNF